ncbi:MAG: TetR/AcrR family transcriptional regulator, partial [Alphaproteobacteria bacterium]|nr:TetR/AcrR family transcriptional regulator [Alphaproteobacteria bacterium]
MTDRGIERRRRAHQSDEYQDRLDIHQTVENIEAGPNRRQTIAPRVLPGNYGARRPVWRARRFSAIMALPHSPPRNGFMAKARAKTQRTDGQDGSRHDGRILDAALAEIAAQGWRTLSHAGVAKRSGLSPSEVRARFPDRLAFLEALFLRADCLAAAEGRYDADDPHPARDRLFDVLMRRFDALAPNRAALLALLRDLPLDPEAAAFCALRLLRSMAGVQDIAGLEATGIQGRIRTKGLLLIYLNALRVWATDESRDMSPTMAALDKGLRTAESLMGALACLPVPKKEGRRKREKK